MNKEPNDRAPVERTVMQDIKTAMLKVANDRPINNAGSFPLRLLWQIFEAADDLFERHEEIKQLTDGDIEAAFREMFPKFIAEYPGTLELDA